MALDLASPCLESISAHGVHQGGKEFRFGFGVAFDSKVHSKRLALLPVLDQFLAFVCTLNRDFYDKAQVLGANTENI